MDWQKILTFFTKKEVLIALGVALVLLVVLLVLRKSRMKEYRKELSDFQVRYNALKSVPLTFKLNKTVSLARMDKNLDEAVAGYKESFELIHTNLKLITQMLSEMEDNLLEGKVSELKLNVIDLEGMLVAGEKDVAKLDEALNDALKQETEQRGEINGCKERFREIKNTWNMNQSQLSFSAEALSEQMRETEQLFTEFEEQMYASDYQKAKECTEAITDHLSKLETELTQLPELLSTARGVIPKQMDHVSETYSRYKQKGLYLQHLDVPKNLEVLSETLKQDLGLLRNADYETVAEHLTDYNTRLEQLLFQLDREDKAYDEMKELSKSAFEKLDNTHTLITEIARGYEKTSDKYGFEDIAVRLKEIQVQSTDDDTVATKLKQLMEEYTVPASTILLSLKEFNQNVESQYNELKEMKDRLDAVRTDEERARKQLLKLQLIMNEIQVKIRCYRLPAVSDQYEGDVREAYAEIRTLEALLEETPLNVSLLSSTLAEAIDFIYKLYNNVNNIVGMAQMVENTIVFANKYRSTYADIDSELTRAELCFRNGEYTQALTVAINAVEKLKVDSYERLIKENATSAA